MRKARRGILSYFDHTPTTAHVQTAELYSGECLWRNAASQRGRWRDRTIAQNVAKPRRIRPRMALMRRKKFGPMRCGMKRTMTVSAVNQVVKPAVAIRIPKPGVL